LSVCIATRRVDPLLVRCLDSLVAQIDPPVFEVLVCADSDDEVVAQVKKRFGIGGVAFAVSQDQAWISPADKRNALIVKARGDVLLFLDDDVVADPHLLATLTRLAAERSTVDVFGGPNLTPPGSSRFQMVQGAVLGSLIASGPTRRRWGRHPGATADDRSFTLCNLAVRRRAMIPFRAGLDAGEENAVLNSLRQRGCEMRYEPDLRVYHERRPTLSGFARQIYKFGRGRGRIGAHDRTNLRLAHLVPSLLLLYLVALPVLAMAHRVFLLPAIAYVLVVAAQALKIGSSFDGRRFGAVAWATLLIPLVHACYGVGVVVGLASHQPQPVAFAATWADIGPP
jgi:glycosyltransferase involved in cell wall biosynthesis